MDGGDVPMTGIQSRADLVTVESIIEHFRQQIGHDLGNIRDGLDSLSRRVEAVPDAIVTELANSTGDSGGVRQWFSQILSPNVNPAFVAELRGDNETLSQQNGALRRDLESAQLELATTRQKLERELDSSRHKVADMEGQLLKGQEEVKRLREKEAMFRNMILDNAGTRKISDGEILERFVELRQHIQKISFSPLCLVDTNPALSAAQEEATALSKKFYKPAVWGDLRVSDRQFRLRAGIFEELHYHILDYDCFGLEGFQVSDGEKKVSVEPGLRRFEHMLKDRQVSDSVIRDWTITTINCVELSTVQGTTSALAASSILSLLEPILSTGASRSDKDALRTSITELCTKAFTLRMLMRKSKDRYAVEKFKTGTVISDPDIDTRVEAVSVERGKSNERSDLIAFNVFGALTKLPQAAGQLVKVLEKAHVVLRRK